MAQNKQLTLTRELSRNIDAAYEAYKAKAPDAEERLLGAFLEQARNIARFRLKELYDGTALAWAVCAPVQESVISGASRLLLKPVKPDCLR